jgi:hypothetical protein
MAFDEQGFRKAAAAAGYSADEIQSHVAKEKQLPEPKLPESNNYEDFANKDIAQQPSAAKRLEQKAEQVNPAIPYLAAAGAGAVGTAAAIGAGKKIYNSLTDKMAADVQAKQAEIARIEPDLNVSNKPVAGEPVFDVPNYAQTPAPVEAQTKPSVEQLKQKLGVVPELAPVVQPIVQTPVAPQAPVAPQTPIAPQASVAPLVAETVTNVAPNAAEQVTAEKMATPPEGAAPPPAESKKPRKVTPKGVPEGMTELVGGGPGDRWLANEHPELRKSIITMFNEGKPAGSYDRAQELYKQFKAYQAENIAGPVIPKEIAKERGMPPPKNYGPWGTKILKGAGVTGLALTAAEMAQAAEAARQGNYGPARETGFNLLGMIPGLGTAFNTLTYSKGVGETPEELQKLQYIQKVGAGRGVAPPTR